MGLPAIAISLETALAHHLSYSEDVDFSAAAYFTAYFARLLMERRLPKEVNVLKVDVPSDATQDTPWEITRSSRKSYFVAVAPERTSWDVPGPVGYKIIEDFNDEEEGTDVYAVHIKRVVSVTSAWT